VLTYPFRKTPRLPNPAPFPDGTASCHYSKKKKKLGKLNIELNTHNIIEYKKSNAKFNRFFRKAKKQKVYNNLPPS